MTRRTLCARALSGAVALVLSAAPVFAASDIRTERVRFAAGESSAVIEESIKGYETVDYVLSARTGQAMRVDMATKNTAAYFNVLAPGENEVAMFIGSVSGTQYSGTLPKSGDYKVRVYMMRSAARRGEVADYRLEIGIAAASEPSAASTGGGAEADALVPGTDYHATGSVPCVVAKGQPTGSCAFGVTREGGGNAIVTVTKPDGRTRAIFFEKGEATGADVSEADPGEFRASRNGDLTTVRIGDEKYEIPDAVVQGG